MSDEVNNALLRLCAIEKEIPTSPLANNAVPQAFFAQDTMPYWTNRVVSYKVSPTRSQDYIVYRYRFGLCYVRAFLTQGVDGQAEKDLYTDLPIISAYLGGTYQLQSVTYTDQMPNLDPEGAHITDMTVYLGQLHSGIGQKIIGAEFMLDAPITIWTPQRY